MNESLVAMLQKYPLRTSEEYNHALREILQELALCGLWRAKFFEHALFYGGTALRILHGLDRFSEDMDFSLLKSDDGFRLEPYGKALVEELQSFGFKVELQMKTKTKVTAIQSAFLKTDTTLALLQIQAPASLLGSSEGRQLKIKLEMDTNPPMGFADEAKLVLQPIPFSVRSMTPSSLFAGKMHAVLCRASGNRVKGRDWYDMVWYVGRSVPVRLTHLEQRMRQSGHWTSGSTLRAVDFHDLLEKRIGELDIQSAKADVQNFIRDPASISLWSPNFFHQIAKRIQTE
jgi:predicted nucleotidyltransferase component of viral defense system